MTYKVLIVCTGNVARSPALEMMLQRQRPDVLVSSAAIGAKAERNRRMMRSMREVAAMYGYLEEAEEHRSRRFEDVGTFQDLVIALTEPHYQWLLANYVGPSQMVGPVPDPAWGGIGACERTWLQLQRIANKLAKELPHEDRPS